MSFIAVATVGAGLVGSGLSARASEKAGEKAAAAQTASAQAGLDETARQFDLTRESLAPNVAAGGQALQAQLDLIGLGGTEAVAGQDAYTIPGTPGTAGSGPLNINDLTAGQRLGLLDGSFDPSTLQTAGTPGTAAQYVPAVAAVEGVSAQDAQQAAIDALMGGAEFQSLVNQGEGAILSNASATGGLRGGNTQAALAQFRPQVLAELINQQYNRLGALSSSGQNAAAQTGAFGANAANAASGLYAQQGAAQAGSALATGQAQSGLYGDIATGVGNILGTIDSSLGNERLELF